MFQITPMVRNLLLINVAVYFLSAYNIIPVEMFALYDFRSPDFQPYQFITHMFLHGGVGHLFSNMLSLFFFGPLLERHWGSSKFMTFYLICGVGASLLYSGVRAYEINKTHEQVVSYLDNPEPMKFYNFLEEHLPNQYNKEFIVEYRRNPDNPDYIAESKKAIKNIYSRVANAPMLGASGAVFAILMAFGLLFPNLEMMLLFLPVPIKAKYFVTMYGAYELYAGFKRVPGDNVAHFAHLGGMLFAYLLIKYWERNRFKYN